MKFKEGNLFESKAELVLVTGNSYITKDGRLVMGRGAAKELRDLVPGIDFYFGKRIREYFKRSDGIYGVFGKYGVILKQDFQDSDQIMPAYGVFQVKYHFKDDAELGLIKYSTDYLHKMNENLWVNNGYRVAMNFPGIGFGRLHAKDVFPILSKLQDNITIYVKSMDNLYE